MAASDIVASLRARLDSMRATASAAAVQLVEDCLRELDAPQAELLDRPPPVPARHRLPAVRTGLTRRFHIHRPPKANECPYCRRTWETPGDVKVYATVNTFADGSPGELFLEADRVGSTAHGALDAFALCFSIGLQHGVPASVYLGKVLGMRFGEGGYIYDPQRRAVGSVLDPPVRWMCEHWAPELLPER